MFWKKEKTEQTEEIFIKDCHMEKLMELAAKLTDSDSQYDKYIAQRNLWLFLEKEYPVTKEGSWSLNVGSWPRWYIYRR